jgi:DamX protein
MDTTDKPDLPDQPGSAATSLETRIGLLERQLAEQQDQLRDYEKSLVERIADVDDDRRTTATKLQRAWQTQREEMDERFGRQNVLLLGALLVLALLIGILLFFGYRHLAIESRALASDLAGLEQRISGVSPAREADTRLQDELTRLASAVDAISASLTDLDQDYTAGVEKALASESANREQNDARLETMLKRLEAEQERLAGEIDTTREALQAIAPISPGPAPTEDAPVFAPARPAEETDAGVAAEIRDERSVPRANEQDSSAEGAAHGTAAAGPDGSTEDLTPQSQVVSEASATDRPEERAYALQLIGFFQLADLEQFAQRNRGDLPARLYYREDTYRGRPWFALIHSMHDSYSSAEAARSRLAPDLAALDPWIRPMGRDGGIEVLGIE